MARSLTTRPFALTAAVLGVSAALALSVAVPAHADNLIDLQGAARFGVLGGTTVTNTGLSTVLGDVGVSPGTAVTGFQGGPGVVTGGQVRQNDALAIEAQASLQRAYLASAALTPQANVDIGSLGTTGLTPGVYASTGVDALLPDNGAIAFAGSAASTWVFQIPRDLTIGANTRMTFSGGASGCNVYWQVGGSATLGGGSAFAGTVMAQTSISVVSATTVDGRLLARNGAVTLDTTTIVRDTSCNAAPLITSGAPTTATEGTPYTFPVTSTGTPDATYTATGLPAGLSIDATTGVISGTPTTPGTSTVTITASNGTSPDDTSVVTITVRAPAPVPTATPTPTAPAVAPTGTPSGPAGAGGGGGGTGQPTGELAFTGSDPTVPLSIAAALLAAGATLMVLLRRRRRTVGRI